MRNFGIRPFNNTCQWDWHMHSEWALFAFVLRNIAASGTIANKRSLV
jgi:hypothetical protein